MRPCDRIWFFDILNNKQRVLPENYVYLHYYNQLEKIEGIRL